MLNQQEQNYLESYLLNNYLDGYENYYCETKYNSYNQSTYDVICYLSKDNFELNNSSLVGTNVKECKLDFDVYNDSIDTINCQSLSKVNFVVNKNEISYSTLTNDIIINYKETYKHFNNYNLILSSILFVIIISFLYKFISRILRR